MIGTAISAGALAYAGLRDWASEWRAPADGGAGGGAIPVPGDAAAIPPDAAAVPPPMAPATTFQPQQERGMLWALL